MHQICKATAIAAVALSATTDAFTAPRALLSANTRIATPSFQAQSSIRLPSTQLYNAEEDDAQDNEIARLQKMAAKLRAEAASLEADKAKQLAEAAEKAFNRFDINSDGEVSLSELKLGLEKELKVRSTAGTHQILSHVHEHLFSMINYYRILTF